MKTMKIDIVSDIACPWCSIGYARLEQAMDRLADELDFEIEWHAFELNPDADGEPILKALSRKYGRSPEEMDAAQTDMTRIASELGLNFSRMKERRTRNTFDAHRLVKWAGEHGRQTEMKKAFFDAYFGEAENIADPEVLLARVETIGLDVNEARRILESDKFATEVRADEARYQQAGVSAVPAFIIDQMYMISGAQEPETLVQSFRQIASGAESPS